MKDGNSKLKVLLMSFVVVVVFVVACFALVGCGETTSQLVKANMSEWTKVFYYGETEGLCVSLSSGIREMTYLLNGRSEAKVDFSLLSFNFEDKPVANIIKAKVFVGEQEKEIELEVGGVNSNYLADLEQGLTGEENIKVVYAGKEVVLENLSKDFVISSERALEIACEELHEAILGCRSGKNLSAEGYLRVLDKKANNFEELFWCFTLVNVKNESFSVIISTVDGSVLGKIA